jgi:hypothetical protein
LLTDSDELSAVGKCVFALCFARAMTNEQIGDLEIDSEGVSFADEQLAKALIYATAINPIASLTYARVNSPVLLTFHGTLEEAAELAVNPDVLELYGICKSDERVEIGSGVTVEYYTATGKRIAYLPDGGYIDATGLHSLSEVAYQAQNGSVKYETLAEAIEATQADDTVTLLADVTEAVIVSKVLTIEKNGYTAAITAGEGYAVEESDEAYIVSEAAEELFEIDYPNIRMGSDLSLLFAFNQSKLRSLEGVYAEITKEVAGGEATTTIVRSTDKDMWTTATIYGEKHYVVEFSGLAAKEMGNEVTIVIRDAEGNALSKAYTSSLRAYAMEKLETSTNAVFKVSLVDMLNYGAEAQKYFTYNTDDLVNADLSEEQKALASAEGIYTNKREADEAYYNATNLRFESKINLLLRVKIPYGTYAVFSWTDHYGNAHSKRIENSEYATSSGMYVLELDELVVADARVMVTCTIYNNADDTVVTTIVDSCEGEVAGTSSTSEVKALYIAYMKFADSAYKYMHS